MNIINDSEEIGVSYAQKNFIYEILSETNKDLIYEAAESLADTFWGIKIGSTFISEPVLKSLDVSKEVLTEYLVQFLGLHAKEGITIIAKAKESGKLVGVVASESYNPEQIIPQYKGNFKRLNKLTELCSYLDNKYSKFIQLKTGKKLQKDEHIHLFMIGVRLEKNKKYVGMEMVKLLEKVGTEKGYKSIFAEATNFRSQKLFALLNWSFPLDNEGRPIVYTYANDFVFKNIPTNISLTCDLCYKPLN